MVSQGAAWLQMFAQEDDLACEQLISHAGLSVPSHASPLCTLPPVLTQVRARFVERFSMGAPVMGGEVRGPAITGEAGWEGCCCDGSVVACD